MTIWSSEIKVLEDLNESLTGQLPGLEKELAKAYQACRGWRGRHIVSRHEPCSPNR